MTGGEEPEPAQKPKAEWALAFNVYLNTFTLLPSVKTNSTVYCISLLCAALSHFNQLALAAKPANPNTRAPARAVLDYFHELSTRIEGRRILSGQFSNFGYGANLRIMEHVHEQTRHWPVIIGVDHADFSLGCITTKVQNQVALDYWKQGGLAENVAPSTRPSAPPGIGGQKSEVGTRSSWLRLSHSASGATYL